MAFSTLLCCIENVLFTDKSRSYKLLALVSGVSERHSHCHTAMYSALEKECDGLHGTQPPYLHPALFSDDGSWLLLAQILLCHKCCHLHEPDPCPQTSPTWLGAGRRRTTHGLGLRMQGNGLSGTAIPKLLG